MDARIEKLYLWGDVDGEGNIACPIETSIVLFVLNYCDNKDIHCCVVGMTADMHTGDLQHHRLSCVRNAEFLKCSPEDVRRCTLPAIHTGCMVRMGMCAVLRHIVMASHSQSPQHGLLNLLGYKGICLKSCAEVSVWTKFCEVEMPRCVQEILHHDRKCENTTIPCELMKLENHLGQPAIIPNIGKRTQAINKKKQHQEHHRNCVAEKMDTDTGLEHVYAEGTDMTLTDLILFPCVTCLLNQRKDKLSEVQRCIPRVLGWYRRLRGSSLITNAADVCGLPTVRLPQHADPLTDTRQIQPSLDVRDPNKKKFKAQPAQISQVLQNLEGCGVSSAEEDHPCGSDLRLNWDDMPPGVNPAEGDLPGSRVTRKCEQLENLACTVVHVAKDNDIIVDFCSGGGHLGILLAHLLPSCKVILVENKEESIVRGEKRIQSLGLSNVIMYQCNMDYFIGSFDIGVCLHACGVATDLVLQRCLDNQAAFVICPCCYGGIQNTHTMHYPRSRMFRERNISYEDYLVLGHAADQTQIGIKQAGEGKKCMLLIDTDRASSARELGYDVTLCSLNPMSCSPKNDLLIGTPPATPTSESQLN